MADLRGQVRRLNRAPRRAQRDRPLDFVLQLADIARPPILRERIQAVGAELDVRFAEPLRGLAEKERAEMGDFLAPLAQRRHVDADDAQAIVQIFAEFPFCHPLFEVRIRRRHDAHVDPLRPRVADRHDLRLLEKSQQLRLHVERQVADLVEEQRAAGGAANQAGLVGNSAGEAAAPVAE